jgi:heavy metal sensor kinase
VPIRVRLALLFALATAVLVGAGGTAFVLRLHQALVASVDAGLRVRADALVETLAPDGGGVDFQGNGPGGLIARTQALAQVIAPDGRLLESSDAAGGHRLLADAQLARALRHAVWATTHTGADREPTRLLAVPVGRGQQLRVAVVGGSLEAAEDAIARVRTGLIGAGAALVVLAGAGAWLLARAALRPVDRMRRQAAEISEHDAEASLEVPGTGDEVAALARTLNALLDRLRSALARQRELIADAGHELRTPLAILRTELELAGRPGRSPAELADAVAAAAGESQRLAELAEDLLLLARRDHGHPLLQLRPTPLAPVVRASAEAASARAAARGVELRVGVDTDETVTADPRRVRQALDNLLDNALRFAPPGSAVDVGVHRNGEAAVIEVADRGPGFPEGFLPHAFERFRRADEARARPDGGTGLGLAIVAAIAQAHGGGASAANRPDGGAQVRLELPVVPGGRPGL